MSFSWDALPATFPRLLVVWQLSCGRSAIVDPIPGIRSDELWAGVRGYLFATTADVTLAHWGEYLDHYYPHPAHILSVSHGVPCRGYLDYRRRVRQAFAGQGRPLPAW